MTSCGTVLILFHLHSPQTAQEFQEASLTAPPFSIFSKEYLPSYQMRPALITVGEH